MIFDENLPRPLAHAFGTRCRVFTVQKLGLAGVKNGALLARLEGKCDVVVTADKNLRYQQNLAGRNLAIVQLPTNRWPPLQTIQARVVAAVEVNFDEANA